MEHDAADPARAYTTSTSEPGNPDAAAEPAPTGAASASGAASGANPAAAEPEFVEAEALPFADGARAAANAADVPTAQKIKGAAQMAAGGALAAAGVPMLVLPSPGAVAIVGGAAIASRGHCNFTGREATPIEQKLDDAAAKAADVAKEQAKKTARKVAQEAPAVAGKAARGAASMAGKVAKEAPVVAGKIAEAAPMVAEKVAEKTPVVAEEVARRAPDVARTVAGVTARGAGIAARAGSALVGKGRGAIRAKCDAGKR
ncbi:MAG TPA: hypothetical protein H9823_03185 [Candidatus Rubneribacter avistercoris]|nr:hypothetical protein [Candidatus Rubneribacter avistercoris]